MKIMDGPCMWRVLHFALIMSHDHAMATTEIHVMTFKSSMAGVTVAVAISDVDVDIKQQGGPDTATVRVKQLIEVFDCESVQTSEM